VEFAGEMQADFVNVTRQVMPAVHRFARAARVNDFTHVPMFRQPAANFKFEICFSATSFHLSPA
jgi:hypothetical protein